MQLTLHANRRTHLGASRLVIDASLVRRTLGVLRPGFVVMRDKWLYDYGIQDNEHTPPSPIPYRLPPLT